MPKIGVITEKCYLKQAMPAALIRALQVKQIDVDVITPEDCIFYPDCGVLQDIKKGSEYQLDLYDTIISRTRNPLGLTVLAYAEYAGILSINTNTALQGIRNKAKMAAALELAGIPSARTFLADNIRALAQLPREVYPLILKPTYGENCQGLALIQSPEDLEGFQWEEGLVLAQKYIPSDGYDLKLYVVGNNVFAIRKPTPFRTSSETNTKAIIEQVQPDKAMIYLALKCREVFGLELYCVDTIVTNRGLVVIEVNDFPNYTGIMGIGELIAEHILSQINSREVANACCISVTGS